MIIQIQKPEKRNAHPPYETTQPQGETMESSIQHGFFGDNPKVERINGSESNEGQCGNYGQHNKKIVLAWIIRHPEVSGRRNTNFI